MGAQPTDSSPEEDAPLHQLPPWVQRAQAWLRIRWLGRVVVNGLNSFLRLDMFDRSMTIAAQFFTSVFPILILLATWAATRDTDKIADAIGLPEESRAVLEDAVQGAGSASFGVIGVLIVFASATSLSRALTRAFMAIWDVPKPRGGLGAAWRWLAAVLVLTLALVAIRAASEPIDINPIREALPLVATVGLDLTIAIFVPWVLLAGAIRPRLLVPGALLFALLMLSVRPATAVWLPNALETSAERYGSIGVAFTYLACLYTASLCFLSTSVLGQVIATDPGKLGQWIRRTRTSTAATDSSTLRDVPDRSEGEE